MKPRSLDDPIRICKQNLQLRICNPILLLALIMSNMPPLLKIGKQNLQLKIRNPIFSSSDSSTSLLKIYHSDKLWYMPLLIKIRHSDKLWYKELKVPPLKNVHLAAIQKAYFEPKQERQAGVLLASSLKFQRSSSCLSNHIFSILE